MFRRKNLPWWACAALLWSACVEPGSLDNKAAFEGLLSDGGPLPDGGTPTGGSTAPKAGNGGRGGASGSGGSGSMSQEGCPEACDIIATKCATAGCHAATGSAGMLDLASPDIAGRLRGKAGTTTGCTDEMLIDPDDPENSMLYGKLLNPPICGTLRMPVGAPLPDDQIACMLRWLSNPVCGSSGNAGAGGAGGNDAQGGRGGAGNNAQGGRGGSAAPPSGTSVWIEAEDAVMLNAPMESMMDDGASGGEFIQVPLGDIRMTAPTDTGGSARYEFEVTESGNYRIWGRLRVPDGESDSWWVRVDDGTWYVWNRIAISTEWAWDDVHDSSTAADTVIDFELDEGEHTLDIAYREDGCDLDKILITNDLDFMPTGEGE